MLAAVSSREAADSSVRCARCRLPAASSREPVSIWLLASRTLLTELTKACCIRCIARTRRPISVSPSPVIRCVRSPLAICSSWAIDSSSGRRIITRSANQASSASKMLSRPAITISVILVLALLSASFTRCWPIFMAKLRKSLRSFSKAMLNAEIFVS